MHQTNTILYSKSSPPPKGVLRIVDNVQQFWFVFRKRILNTHSCQRSSLVLFKLKPQHYTTTRRHFTSFIYGNFLTHSSSDLKVGPILSLSINHFASVSTCQPYPISNWSKSLHTIWLLSRSTKPYNVSSQKKSVLIFTQGHNFSW